MADISRKQFTFYDSFYKSAKSIRKAADRERYLMAIIEYALYGKEPEDLPEVCEVAFSVVMPVLLSSRRKSENGAKGGKQTTSKTEANESKAEANESKTEANESKAEARYAEANGSKPQARSEEANRKQVKEQEKEEDKDKEQYVKESKEKARTRMKQDEFETFWKAYPNKAGKDAARKAWDRLTGVTLDQILSAIENHKRSRQWQEDGGHYIPYPATWLNQKRWEDELPSGNPSGIPKGASGSLGDAELEAIRQAMAQPQEDYEMII